MFFHLVREDVFILVSVNVLTVVCEDVFHLVCMFFHLVREDVFILVSVNVSHRGV